ncbi:FAD binding domain-containing protein [Neobacillus dielmonensis]|uniref:FAD binding domain-containing protein n=1 Tax=Neobacillus dielmonensis TaxID=1347369 RepID=UPI0005A8C6AE|nr:FAD binding domain-containing protein [Neobacillus dielmonensis]
MLSADIEYYRPATIKAATELFFSLKGENKRPVYYSGGTEILTLGRLDLIQPGALIDIKAIKECLVFEFDRNNLLTGAALPLTYIEDANLFPLLSATSMGIADHTARNKITLGGNLCGQIFYREAVLPFLLCDSVVTIAGQNGVESLPIGQIFNQTFQLAEGQFIIQIMTERRYVDLPFVSIKKRQQWETGYPLLTVAAIKVENQLRFAFSGLCPFPFRSKEMEDELNKAGLSLPERVKRAIGHIPGPVLHDVEGSSEYRLFVLENTLNEIIIELEGR